MDQATKQRLVGAIVLVVALLWLVPVFLDGPGDSSPTISETVELPGVEPAPNQRQTIELRVPESGAADEESAPSAVALPVPDTGGEQQAGSTEAAEREPEVDPPVGPESAAETAATPQAAEPAAQQPAVSSEPPARDSNLFAVQLGSFTSRDNANRLAADLRARGFAAFLSEHEVSGKTQHRVRVGPLADRPEAEAEAARLAAAGHTGRVVAHP